MEEKKSLENDVLLIAEPAHGMDTVIEGEENA